MSDELKPHFDILDRYQAFSAELSRISLLGVAAIGFLLSSVSKATKDSPSMISLEDNTTKYCLIASAISLSIAAGLSLVYRYFSTDSMASIVSLHFKSEAASNEWLSAERRQRNVLLKMSFWLLIGSSTMLCFGAVLLAGTFILAVT